MIKQIKERNKFSSILFLVLTLLGIAYLIAIPFDLLKRKFEPVDLAVLVALLLFNSGFLQRLGRLVIGGKGVELELKEVKIEQEKQRIEIDTLRFLIASYVTEKELVHLIKLAGREPFPYTKNASFESELRRLRSLDFIRNFPGKTVTDMPSVGELTDHFEITDKGSEYVRLRHDLAVEEIETTQAGRA